MVLSPSWPLDVGCKMLVSSCVFWIVPRSMLQVAFFWPCTLNGPHTSAVALSVVLALSPLSPGWAPWSWFILSCLGLPRDPVTSVLLKSCGMTPGFLRMLCVQGSHLTSHLLLTVEQVQSLLLPDRRAGGPGGPCAVYLFLHHQEQGWLLWRAVGAVGGLCWDPFASSQT